MEMVYVKTGQQNQYEMRKAGNWIWSQCRLRGLFMFFYGQIKASGNRLFWLVVGTVIEDMPLSHIDP